VIAHLERLIRTTTLTIGVIGKEAQITSDSVDSTDSQTLAASLLTPHGVVIATEVVSKTLHSNVKPAEFHWNHAAIVLSDGMA
jgi:hypothetical protein